MFCDFKLLSVMCSGVQPLLLSSANGFADRKVNRHFAALQTHGVSHRVGVYFWTKNLWNDVTGVH